MQTRNLCSSVSNLWAWLQTWLDERGGVHGYVVHHHRDNLKVLSPDTWTQSPCILGLVNLYRKTGHREWLEEASELCDYLTESYIWRLHAYRNSNHEHKPLGRPELISNTIASYALLRFAKEIKDESDDWQRYYLIARDNLTYLLSNYWDSSVGAMLDPAHDAPQRIHNMNSVTIISLVALAEMEGDMSYVKYAEKISRYILACQVKEGKLKGAYPYRDDVGNYIALYSLITCLGLLVLYKRTKSPELISSAKKAFTNLANFFDKGSGLVCHYHRSGYPQWIPDTLLLAVISRWLSDEGIEVKFDANEILTGVLLKQYASGGFPLSIGFEDLWYSKGLPSRPDIKRWRDALPTTNWNSWNFWALSELIPENAQVGEPNIRLPLIIKTDAEEGEGPYQIIEDEHEVVFTSFDNEPYGIFHKRSEIADLCLIKERDRCWRIKNTFNKYPMALQKLILEIPKFF